MLPQMRICSYKINPMAFFYVHTNFDKQPDMSKRVDLQVSARDGYHDKGKLHWIPMPLDLYIQIH